MPVTSTMMQKKKRKVRKIYHLPLSKKIKSYHMTTPRLVNRFMKELNTIVLVSKKSVLLFVFLDKQITQYLKLWLLQS